MRTIHPHESALSPFSDESLDLVITSDAMEHVCLDDLAHREIYRVLKPSGVYIFTVPHDRSLEQTMIRVQVNDPNDPEKDVHCLSPNITATQILMKASVRCPTGYGRNLESYLTRLGFELDYSRKDLSNFGILNTELYYCRKNPAKAKFSPENG